MFGPPNPGKLTFCELGLPACLEHGVLKRPRVNQHGELHSQCNECPFENQDFSVSISEIPNEGIWHLLYMDNKYSGWVGGETKVIEKEASSRGIEYPSETEFYVALFEGISDTENLKNENQVYDEMSRTFEDQIPSFSQFAMQTPESKEEN